jgi:hypothetical protein
MARFNLPLSTDHDKGKKQMNKIRCKGLLAEMLLTRHLLHPFPSLGKSIFDESADHPLASPWRAARCRRRGRRWDAKLHRSFVAETGTTSGLALPCTSRRYLGAHCPHSRTLSLTPSSSSLAPFPSSLPTRARLVYLTRSREDAKVFQEADRPTSPLPPRPYALHLPPSRLRAFA